ncbi:MAG: SCO family protein [Xanthobacteraceae bacterium]
MTRSSRLAVLAVSFAVGLAVCAGLVFVMTGRFSNAPAFQSATVGGPFELTDQNGKPISDKDLRGKPFLVFFGFTHCPDVCPTALFEVSEILRGLGPDADRVGALFVSVDPERDTPAVLRDYLSSFDPHLRGLTGDPAAVAAVAKAYRVYYKKVPLEEGDYTMDHTALVYLMDKQGRFVAPFNIKQPKEAAIADLRRYL